MDFGNAALLIFIVFVVTQFAKQLLPDPVDSRVTQVVAIAVGIAATLLVAHSDWGHKQVIDGIALDTMNTASLVLVGLAIAGGATVAHQVVQAVRNVGENQPPPEP